MTSNAQIEEAINLLTANGYYIVVNDAGRHDAQVERYVLLGHAMIEQCAQVAENYDQDDPVVSGRGVIAAAIRALKVKP